MKNIHLKFFINYSHLKEVLRIMKLSTLLLVIGVLNSFAGGYSQDVSISVNIENGTLADLFNVIEKNTEYKIFYKSSLVDQSDTMNLMADQRPVSELLSEVLSRRNLAFDLVDKVIIITAADRNQQQKVTGTVTDASSRDPLPGVYVLIEGTNSGSITDANGKYSVDISREDAVLVFSFVGYNTEKIPVAGKTNIDVPLVPDIMNLEEVVVIGYGTMKKSDLTGAIVSVSGEDLKASVVNTLDQALQGRASGVQVVSNSGQPGSATSVRIRGINSLQSSNEPLYVIDGVQVSGNNVSTIGFNFAGGGNSNSVYSTSPLSFINPSDIESIEVLKDASACAIYGNQGANGVILVTTKQGKANESKIRYEYSLGWKSLAKKIDMLSLQDYATYTNELYEMKGLTPRTDLADPSSLTGGTDWQDEVFQTAMNTKHQLSVSGGSDKTTYYIGAGYQYDEGIVVNTWFKRYNLRVNLENQTRSWLKVGTNMNLGQSNTKLTLADSNDGPIIGSLIKAPDVPVYNADGTFAGPTFDQLSPGGVMTYNPVAQTIDRDTRQKKVEFLANTYGEVKWDKFILRNEVGVTIGYINDFGFSARVKHGEDIMANNQLQEGVSNNTNIEIKNILSYINTFNGVHSINAMVAHESRSGKYQSLNGSRSNFLSNSVNQMSNGDASTMANLGFSGVARSESYIGRLFYNYADLAMLTASYRFDGSYKFPKGKRWGAFPSISAALRLSNLDFLKGNLGPVNNLKINGSYGETGNSNIEDYLYLSNVLFRNTTMGQGVYFSVPNPNITWETTKSSNLGLEVGALDNRIMLQLEIYKKKTVNALNNINLPNFVGANLGIMRANAGSIQNKGFEITLSTVNMSGGFKWKTDFTFTRNRNKVLSLGLGGVPITGGGGQFKTTTSYTIEGGPIGRFYGYVVDGLYQNLDDIITSARWSDNANDINPGTGLWLGDLKFKDLDKTSTGDWDIVGYQGTVTDGKYVPGTAVYTGNPEDIIHLKNVSFIDSKDRTFIGDPNPKFIFSINNTFTYGNFDLSVFINGVYGNKILNYNRLLTELGYLQNINQSVTMKRRAIPILNTGGDVNNPADYTLKNPNSSIPRMRIDANPGVERISSRYIEDGSYIRIQNVVLGYSLPGALVQKIHLGNLRLYANIQNLATFTKYTGFDPEIGNQAQSSILQGVDNGHYPLARTFMLGVQVDF
jgi:TonB-dependent starch-binding outer membrane protein SusC